MSLNVSAVTGAIAKFGVTGQQALTIFSEVVSLVGLAQQLATELSGNQKFQAVMDGLDAVLASLNLTDRAADLKARLAPVINMLVAAFHFLNLWDKLDTLVPAPAAKSPASDPGPDGQ